MRGNKVFCADCGNPAWWGSEELGSVVSHCVCEDKRVKCDCCGHMFLPKDMSMDNMFLVLCKLCNEHEPYLMDNMAVARFEHKSDRPFTMLCVEPIGEYLQLTIRAYHLGVSIIFPAMKKQELVSRWIFSGLCEQKAMEEELLFDAAFLRLMPDYMAKSEVANYRQKLMHSIAVPETEKEYVPCRSSEAIASWKFTN